MLYGWFYQEILGYLHSLTRNRPQAEDLTQDTFLRAMAHAHQLSKMDKPACKAWLYRTAKNLFLDSVRRRKRETKFLTLTQTYQQDFSEFLVEQILSSLTKEDQQLFRMRYLEGFNASQVGERYGLPPATVRTRLARARQQLKAMIEYQEREPTP